MAYWECHLCPPEDAVHQADNVKRALHLARQHYLNAHYYDSLQPPITARERHSHFERQLRRTSLTPRGERVGYALACVVGGALGWLSGPYMLVPA